MWQTLVIALAVLAVLVLGAAVLQSAEFRSVFRRRHRFDRPADHMPVKGRPDRDSPSAPP